MINDFEIIEKARKKKISFVNYLNLIFKNFQELSGDRYGGDDKSIIGGIANLNNISVIVIGQQKNFLISEKYKSNYGMPNPEGYRKSLRLFKLAEKFSLPVITFIDTPGADLNIKSEKKGQSIAIANNLEIISSIKTIIISIIIGEGCSGGALAMCISDKLFILKNAYLSPIIPENCISILSKKCSIIELISSMHITPKKLIKLKLVDKIIKNTESSEFVIKNLLIKHLNQLSKINIKFLLKKRQEKIKNFGTL